MPATSDPPDLWRQHVAAWRDRADQCFRESLNLRAMARASRIKGEAYNAEADAIEGRLEAMS